MENLAIKNKIHKTLPLLKDSTKYKEMIQFKNDLDLPLYVIIYRYNEDVYNCDLFYIKTIKNYLYL